MRGAAARIGKVVAAYALFAALALAALPAVQRTFLLPELFDAVARWSLGLGAILAAVVAWRYPHVGDAAGGPRADGRTDGGAEHP
ncbi:MAG: hypothetical protein AMXMBFR53_23930 [Gemmatimonadota bacterium]